MSKEQFFCVPHLSEPKFSWVQANNSSSSNQHQLPMGRVWLIRPGLIGMTFTKWIQEHSHQWPGKHCLVNSRYASAWVISDYLPYSSSIYFACRYRGGHLEGLNQSVSARWLPLLQDLAARLGIENEDEYAEPSPKCQFKLTAALMKSE